MTTNLTTSTAATYRITRGHESQVIEEAQRLYAEHVNTMCVFGCLVTTATFRDAAERIISLEEAVRSRDKVIVETHDELVVLRDESDSHAADARYWQMLHEGKS
jgi:hypothetical protein